MNYANPADRLKYLRAINKKGFVKDYELKLRKKDGSLIDCLVTSTARRVEGKDAPEYQAIIRDITDRKKAEKALQDSEEFTSSISDNFPLSIIVINPDTSIRYVNPALEMHINKE